MTIKFLEATHREKEGKFKLIKHEVNNHYICGLAIKKLETKNLPFYTQYGINKKHHKNIILVVKQKNIFLTVFVLIHELLHILVYNCLKDSLKLHNYIDKYL
jgi:Zn-dependent peptidase ImmA (M78 family)